MTDHPIRVALVGCGDISRSHCGTYQELNYDVRALCDLMPERAEDCRSKYGFDSAEIYTDYTKLVERDDIDIVTVATPVAFHAPVAIAALRAGKQVACEKPSTLSRDENKAVIAAVEETGNKVIFFSARRRGGYVPLAKQYIDEGKLGDIYRVDVRMYRRRGRPGLDCVVDAHWFLNKELAGGGVVMDMGQYFMDSVLHLTNWPTITAVSATTFKGFSHDLPAERVFDVEEHCTILARTDNGCTFTFDFAWIAHHEPQNYTMLLGTEGGIRMGDGTPFVFYNEPRPWQWMNQTTDWKNKTKEQLNMYAKLAANARGEDVYVGTNAEEALAITELTDMAFMSAERGSEVRREELE